MSPGKIYKRKFLVRTAETWHFMQTILKKKM